jgi:hypothetical protein
LTTATTIALSDLRGFDERVVKVALPQGLSRWASGRPHATEFRRIYYDVIQEILKLHQSDVVPLLRSV